MTDQQLIDEGYKDGKKSFEYLAKRIYEGINWQNIHKTMVAVGWYWKLGVDDNGRDNMGIPSIETIQNHAYAMLKTAYTEERQLCSGGFTAGWDEDELFLVFTLEEASYIGR